MSDNQPERIEEFPIPAFVKAFMHLSLLDEIVCFRNDEIDYDYLLQIRDKCKQLGAGLDIIINNRNGIEKK